jgi:hypothetical protein
MQEAHAFQGEEVEFWEQGRIGAVWKSGKADSKLFKFY